jgi:GTP-binding protein LepA
LTIEGPWIKATIPLPDAYLGPILALCEERRGEQVDLTYAGNRAMMTYRMLPPNEVVFHFYDQLKSVSRGYASFDYQLDDYRQRDLVLMNILVNVEPVEASSAIVHRSEAERHCRPQPAPSSRCRSLAILVSDRQRPTTSPNVWSPSGEG